MLIRHCGEHFNRIDIGRKRGRKRRRPRPETKDGNAAYRYDVLQWVLEDLENGIDEIEVARSFGIGDQWLGCVRDAAGALLKLRTRTGKRRLFGSRRLAETAELLSPTRGAGPVERVLDAALGALVRARYQADPSAIRFVCEYWLKHITAARPDVPFHKAGDLQTFLETFEGIGLEALSLDRPGGADWRQPHWALRVWLPESDSPQPLLDAWAVFGGVAVAPLARYRRPRPANHPQGPGPRAPWFPNANNHPNGIAYLYLDKGAGPRGEPRRNSSQALGCVLHRGNVLLAADDLMKKRPSDGHRPDAGS